MAILNTTLMADQTAGRRIKLDGLPVKGTFLATCFEIEERHQVERKKYQSEETEIVDLIRFYFGYKAKDGTPQIIVSKPFKISGHEKSALFQFLKQWLGDAPTDGFDTASMLTKGAQITVGYSDSLSGKKYANIASIGPVMDGLESSVPRSEQFNQYLEPLASSKGGKTAQQKREDEDDQIGF